jgi:hypothetical protein
MPKKRRQENKGLPKRWRFKCGAYRYLVPAGQESQWDSKKEFTLGKTLPEAYKVWSERLEVADDYNRQQADGSLPTRTRSHQIVQSPTE